MKKYINKTTNKWYYEGKSLTWYKDGALCSGVPSEEDLAELGYEEYVAPVVESTPYVPTYEERVVELIRERYSLDDELAILRQRDSKEEEFGEYFAYCEQCKARARAEGGAA